MKKNLTLIISCTIINLFYVSLKAQSVCGFDIMQAKRLKTDKNFQNHIDAFEKTWIENQNEKNSNKTIISGSDTTYEIPVVFHIIHLGSAEGTQFNPTFAKLQGVIDYLNQTYAATWPSYPGVSTGGVNIPLRFVLAKRDPSCNPTNGVTRHNAYTALTPAKANLYNTNGVNVLTSGGVDETDIKGIIQWDPSLYYNVWVVSKIDGWSGYVAGSGVVGFAYFPGVTPTLDGTIIMEAFNVAGESTLPHEIGHAFNLYHTFEGGCNLGACLTTGDKVCDTDPHDQPTGCPLGTNVCTGTSWVPVIYNIMNYSSCPDRFSEGQKNRVLATILSSRYNLVTSLGGTAIGDEITYPEPPLSVSCTPSSIAHPNNNNGMGPTTMSIGDWKFNSGSLMEDNYQFYIDHTKNNCLRETTAPFTLEVNHTYPVKVKTQLNPQHVRIWIDFNGDGILHQTNELVFSSNGVTGDNIRIHTGNTINIPTSAVLNQPLRVRILADFYGVATPNSCGSNLAYGQIEDFSVILTNTTLPILLQEVTAQAHGQKINISWKISPESSAYNFEVEKSIDTKNFNPLGIVYTQNNQVQYSLVDEKPVANQMNYYRLKIFDKDGSYLYSETVAAQIEEKNHSILSLSPNPVKDLLSIFYSKNCMADVLICNTLGQVVYQKSTLQLEEGMPENIKLKDLSLAKGLYYIQIREHSGESTYGKFLKL